MMTWPLIHLGLSLLSFGVALLAVVIAACNDSEEKSAAQPSGASGDNGGAPPPPVVPPASSSRSATLDWLPPLTKTDGSSLNNLAGYRIYYGTSPSSLTRTVTLNKVEARRPSATSNLPRSFAIRGAG